MVYVDDNSAIGGNYNGFSIVTQIGDMTTTSVSLRLRTIVDGQRVLLLYDRPVSVDNIFDKVINLGDITFTFEEAIIFADDDSDGIFDLGGCTDPLALNYNPCAFIDNNQCFIPQELLSAQEYQTGCNDLLVEHNMNSYVICQNRIVFLLMELNRFLVKVLIM